MNSAPPVNRRAFWDKHPGLVWSNRNAPDDAFISAALRKNRFLQLLDIAKEFGPERLREQWRRELAEGDLSQRLIARVEENLQIIEQAKAHAAAVADVGPVNKAEPPRGPKAHTIPAWGNAPGTIMTSPARAESPSHHSAPWMMDRAFSPPISSRECEPGASPQAGMDRAFGPCDIAGCSLFDGIIPPLPLLFQTKALAACGRSTVRDWVDLYILMTQHGFTMDDFAAAYEVTGSKMQLDIAFNRLTSGQPRAGDPGIDGLMENPPSVKELTGFFREEIRIWKQTTAIKALNGHSVR